MSEHAMTFMSLATLVLVSTAILVSAVYKYTQSRKKK